MNAITIGCSHFIYISKYARFAKIISFTVPESEQYCILIDCEKLEKVGGKNPSTS